QLPHRRRQRHRALSGNPRGGEPDPGRHRRLTAYPRGGAARQRALAADQLLPGAHLMAGVRGSWNGSGAVLYDVYRDATLLLAGIAGLSFTDGNATPGLHTYGVVARNSVGSSVEAQASITVPSTSDVI